MVLVWKPLVPIVVLWFLVWKPLVPMVLQCFFVWKPLVPMVLQWFLVQQPLDTMVFQWFPMVANLWSEDGMVTIHRHGLVVNKVIALWRKVKQMQPMWLCFLSGKQFEDTSESLTARWHGQRYWWTKQSPSTKSFPFLIYLSPLHFGRSNMTLWLSNKHPSIPPKIIHW